MSTVAVLAFGSARVASTRVVRLVLERGEVCRVSRRLSRVSVQSGTAWIASGGRDYLLAAGERLTLPPARDTLLSSVGEAPLFVELGP
jgi:hypothetical protein